MRLTEGQQRMRGGEMGAAARVAVEQQIAVGEFFGAERLVAVSNVHMMGDMEAVFDALAEANAFITKNPRRAAEIYVTEARSKLSVDEIERQIRENTYTATPTGVMKFADFMYRTGTIPRKPASWKDVFFDVAHGLPGN